jgi:hypothetical protein
VLHKSHFLRVHHALTVTSTGLADAPDAGLSSLVGSPQTVAPAASAANGTATPPDLNIPGPATAMPLPTAGSPRSMVHGPWLAAGVQTIWQAGPEPALVLQGPSLDHRREPTWTGPDVRWVLDAVLADLVTDADRSCGEPVDGRSGVPGLPGDVDDCTEPERIPRHRIDPAGFARPVELPPRVRPVERGLIRMDSISDASLDEVAAAAVGSSVRLPVPADPIARPEPPPEPGKDLARLAATVIVAGSWGHRARFRAVTSRQAGRPRDRQDSQSTIPRRARS